MTEARYHSIPSDPGDPRGQGDPPEDDPQTTPPPITTLLLPPAIGPSPSHGEDMEFEDSDDTSSVFSADDENVGVNKAEAAHTVWWVIHRKVVVPVLMVIGDPRPSGFCSSGAFPVQYR